MKRVIIALTILYILAPRSLHARTITVGVYDNYPKVFVDKEGKPAGIFIDILEYIARQENWEIKYKTYSWQDGLDALERGEIDIMPDVSLNEERAKKFTFSQISVLSSWLQIYRRYDVSMKTIEDLRDKKIAVLRGSVQEGKIKEIVEQLKLNCQVIIYDDYASAEQSVINGVTDGVVAGNFYAFSISSSGANKIIPSHLIFSPSTLHFAAPLHKNTDVIEAIDYHLSISKNQYPSIFQDAHYKWLGSKPQTIIPRYIFIIIIIISISLFIALVVIFVMYVKKMRVLQEKEILLREIHHRVKNNMQVICSLLSLHSGFSEDNKMREVVDEINQQIRVMSLAHEMLYHSSNFVDFRAKEYISRLVEQIFGKTTNKLQRINLTQNVDDIYIDIDVAVPLGFIVTELISNCLKHAFKGREQGEISILLRNQSNQLIELIVSDDGVGIPEVIDVKNPKTLGLELISIFVTKLNGSIVFEREKVGTKVTIRVKNEMNRKKRPF